MNETTEAFEPGPHPTLSRDDQRQVGGELQYLLFELIDLTLVARQMDWCLVGSRSGELRAALAGWRRRWDGDVEAIAGRMRAIGWWPEGHPAGVSETIFGLGLEAVPAGQLSDSYVLDELTDRLGECVTRVRALIGQIGSVDPVTLALLTAFVGELEQQLWQVRSLGSK
jgi:DNA-binding ferritin-like protein